jgi:hypothetical protein
VQEQLDVGAGATFTTTRPGDVPAPRRRDGTYKLFPIAHGQSVKKRTKKLVELRAAIMGYGRRYLDANF